MLSFDSRLLIKLWLRAPLRIATAAPSGDRVCAAMVAEADPDAAGWTLELGAGTGPITRALIGAGIAPERLLVVEQNAELQTLLKQRFPQARVVQADAGQLANLFAQQGVDQVSRTISTLPILTMPADMQRRILDQCFAAMGPAGRFAQITYGPASPVPRKRLTAWGYEADVAHFVWKNFPPATIWRYTRES